MAEPKSETGFAVSAVDAYCDRWPNLHGRVPVQVVTAYGLGLEQNNIVMDGDVETARLRAMEGLIVRHMDGGGTPRELALAVLHTINRE